MQLVNHTYLGGEELPEVLAISGSVIFDHSDIAARRDESLNRVLINVEAEVDLSDIIGNSAKFNAGLALQRGEASQFLEDNQIFNNIDAEDMSKLYEVFLEIAPTKNSRLKVGRQDANFDFSAPQYAGNFINSSMGFSPTIALPSYPIPTLAVTWLQDFSNGVSVNFGVFDSAFSDGTLQEQFLISQLNYGFDWGLSFNLGYWHDTAVDHRDFYLVSEYQVDDLQSFSLQYGRGEETATGFASHLGVTWQTEELLKAEDFFGLGFTTVNIEQSSEDVIEVYYGYAFSEAVTLQLDLQYIRTAGLVSEQENALLSTLRMQLSF